MFQNTRLILSGIFDFILPFSPFSKQQQGYAFLVHPRDIKDIRRKYPFARHFSEKSVLRFVKHLWPVTVSKIDGAFSVNNRQKIDGWVISIPLTAKQMTDDRDLASRFIVRAANLAKKRGAKIVSLGALTASLSKGGLDIKKHIDISVTTGRIYTSYIVVETAIKAMLSVGLNINEVKIGIVGSAGSIGTACAQILAEKGVRKMALIDILSKKGRVEELHKKLSYSYSDINIDDEYTLDKLKECDVIIAATNHPEALILSEHVKHGAIIVDDAQPSDISSEIFANRPDVLALEGGVVNAPGINTHFNFGLKGENEIFSCLAEAIILCSINHFDDFQIGSILSIDQKEIERLSEAGKILGFGTGKFQNDIRLYTESDIERVRLSIRNDNDIV